MKANELRIGNLIIERPSEENSNIIPVSIHVFTYMKVNYNIFKPIPLTEEWLIKFGFKKEGLYYKIQIYGDGIPSYIGINVGYGYAELLRNYNHYINSKCEYVHQLQNLYFALTNEELTLI